MYGHITLDEPNYTQCIHDMRKPIQTSSERAQKRRWRGIDQAYNIRANHIIVDSHVYARLLSNSRFCALPERRLLVWIGFLMSCMHCV